LTGVLGGQRVRLAGGRSSELDASAARLGAVLRETSTQTGSIAELARLRAELGR
jgi:hypothetical protein